MLRNLPCPGHTSRPRIYRVYCKELSHFRGSSSLYTLKCIRIAKAFVFSVLPVTEDDLCHQIRRVCFSTCRCLSFFFLSFYPSFYLRVGVTCELSCVFEKRHHVSSVYRHSLWTARLCVQTQFELYLVSFWAYI